ncbi:porin [Solimicrobium silvestre]|uniref:Gram-negative porin n=1 Tax=Solimicrobium silvestre TaxID=2099400 RepID=A0A2S9H552_9BURK|nr:porin [Solimicrobium silvestre]PRC94996.1 Gram-negative porin [Solimicrobium silvestre]
MNNTAFKESCLQFLLLTTVLGACSGQVKAQSNVTLYGRVDAEVNYQSNQNTGRIDSNGVAITGSQWSAPGNEWGTSFFGFKGAEDLGGGMKALFTLESGFATGNGVVNGGSALWSRRAFVGLSGDYGTLKLGRDLTLPSDIVWSLDPTGQQAMGTATLAKGRNWPQTSNQVQYITPDMNGFSAVGMYGFGEVAGSTQDSSSNGIELGYNKDGLELKVMYDVAYDPSGQLSTLFQYSKELTAGGTLTLDKWKLFAGCQTQSAPDMLASYGNPDKATQFWLGANYKITPALTLIPAAFHVNLNQSTGSANLIMLGANYSLSKRTLLFASIGSLHNSALTSFAIEVGNSAVGVNQSAFYTGISQSF